MKVKAVMFDLFGTLTCSTKPEKRIIERFGLNPEIHPGLVRAACGQRFEGWDKFISGVVRAAGVGDSTANRRVVREIFDSALEKGVKGVFPDAKSVLGELEGKGFVLGLVSDCYPVCRRILEENGLAGFFEEQAIVLSYEVGMVKWDREIYNVCLKALGVPAENVAMVGDNPETDLRASREASNGKVRGILVSGDGLAGSGFEVVSSLSEVPGKIAGLEES